MLHTIAQSIILGLMLVLSGVMVYVALTELGNYLLTRVPFVPTRKEDIDDMIRRVKIVETDYFFDLGSGNGKVVFVVEELTGARTKGLQRGGWTQMYAKLKARLKNSRAQFISGNFFDQSWSEATVIYAYLYPYLMNSIAEKALKECQPGTRIVVRDFPIYSLQHEEEWTTPSNHKMYLYII